MRRGGSRGPASVPRPRPRGSRTTTPPLAERVRNLTEAYTARLGEQWTSGFPELGSWSAQYGERHPKRQTAETAGAAGLAGSALRDLREVPGAKQTRRREGQR